MIKANDLRIGNFIIDPEFPLIQSIVSEIQNNGFIVTNYNDHLTNIKADAIKLTPELLEKCGFNVTSKGFYQHPNWYNVSLKYLRGTYNLRCNFMDIIANNIDYLHQLQNLYYSLVGIELEIVW